MFHFANVEKESDAANVALGSGKMEGSPAVIIAHVHINSLVISAKKYIIQSNSVITNTDITNSRL